MADGPPAPPCSAPWTGCTVHWTGLVFPCCSVCEDFGRPSAHAHRMLLGDLRRRSMAEILDGPAAWRLRRAWAAGDLTRHCCDHCHASRRHTCTPYFVDDRARGWIDRAFDSQLLRKRTGVPPVTRLEVQLDSRCQLRCAFCARDYAPTGTPELRGHGSIDPGLFERLLDEAIGLGGDGAELYTHWSGEPLLHPQRERLFAAVGSRPFFSTTLVTNGLALTPAFVDHLLGQLKPPSVYVSLHAATRATFRRTTGRDRFGRVRSHVERLLRSRGVAGRQEEMLVYVGFTVTDANVDELPRFLDEWRSLFAARDTPPAIHLNGRGEPARNTINVVADGLAPFSEAMERARKIVDRARDNPPDPG